MRSSCTFPSRRPDCVKKSPKFEEITMKNFPYFSAGREKVGGIDRLRMGSCLKDGPHKQVAKRSWVNVTGIFPNSSKLSVFFRCGDVLLNRPALHNKS